LKARERERGRERRGKTKTKEKYTKRFPPRKHHFQLITKSTSSNFHRNPDLPMK